MSDGAKPDAQFSELNILAVNEMAVYFVSRNSSGKVNNDFMAFRREALKGYPPDMPGIKLILERPKPFLSQELGQVLASLVGFYRTPNPVQEDDLELLALGALIVDQKTSAFTHFKRIGTAPSATPIP